MNEIKKIMVAVDASDYSLPSLRYARNLAEAVGAKLLLVSVVNKNEMRAIQNALEAFGPSISDEHFKQRVNERHKWLDALINQAGAQAVAMEKVVRVGVPYYELLKAIEEDRPDLLVMGTKGRSNMVDTVMGSCAQKMFRRCPIPLISLRPQKKAHSE